MAEAPLPERRFVESVLLWCNETTVPPKAALKYVLRAAAQEPAEDELVKTINSAVEDPGPNPTEDARSEALEEIKEWVVATDYDGGEERGRAARKRAREAVDDPIPGSSAYREFKKRRAKIAYVDAVQRSCWQLAACLEDVQDMTSIAGTLQTVKAGFGENCFDELKRLCPHIFAQYQERGTLATFEGALSRGTAPAFEPPQSHGGALALEDAPPRDLD